jgi:hypothetical protein
MKKIFSLICYLLIPITLFGQLERSGNLSTETWSQNVHITADATIGDGVTITISAGVTIELYSGVSLNIIGSGTLLADASSGTAITFTAYNGTSWGHLYFSNTSASGNSKLINCIIEKGDAVGLSPAYGGGLSINTNKIDVNNCIIKNNLADIGGGIHIGIGFGPVINNCFIYSNTANYGGGGIHSYAGSTTEFINCIISNNTVPQASNLYGGGGILIGYNANAVKIINCTFANNSCPNGTDINLFGSNSLPKIVNSIFWSSSPIMYSGSQGLNSSDFTNCAIRSSIASSFTDCIEISGINDDATGPNFNATDGSDWSIKVFSPCRDAGTTPSPAVPYDYIGNSRVGTYDIGAYEVQYSIWKTNAATTDWGTSSNWDGLATNSAQSIYIPSGATNYPTGSPAPDFTIGSGKELVLASGAKATFGTLANNGTLTLRSDATSISSLIVTTYSGNAAIVELYLTGGGGPYYKWHYISTPVSTLPVSTFTGVTYDIAGYNEARVSTDLLQGWIGYDGWVYASENPAYDYNYDFNALTPGRGYDFYDAADNKFTFSGTLNTSTVSPTVTFKSGGSDALNGFNLLGNPFSSGLDWDIIASDAGYPASTSKSIFFTRNKSLCSYINQVGSPGDVTGIIPPMQGFFTKTYDQDHTIVLAAAARTHDAIHERYKGKSIIPLVRLSLSEDTISDETVVRFDELAKPGLDNDFDALKMFVSPQNLMIYTAGSGTKYVINGQPFPAPETFVEIPVVINLLKTGNHSITSTQLQGLDTYKVFLIDNTTGFTANLKTTPVVTFSASAGLITDRFILKVSNVTTGIEDPVVSKNIFNIYQGNDLINIQTIADEWDGKTGTVRVLDLTGKTVSDNQNSEFWKNSLIQIPAPGTKGLYIVEIKSGVKRYVGKVVIK